MESASPNVDHCVIRKSQKAVDRPPAGMGGNGDTVSAWLRSRFSSLKVQFSRNIGIGKNYRFCRNREILNIISHRIINLAGYHFFHVTSFTKNCVRHGGDWGRLRISELATYVYRQAFFARLTGQREHCDGSEFQVGRPILAVHS